MCVSHIFQEAINAGDDLSAAASNRWLGVRHPNLYAAQSYCGVHRGFATQLTRFTVWVSKLFEDMDGVRVYLTMGSMLGALKMNTAQPWDDDVDVSIRIKSSSFGNGSDTQESCLWNMPGNVCGDVHARYKEAMKERYGTHFTYQDGYKVGAAYDSGTSQLTLPFVQPARWTSVCEEKYGLPTESWASCSAKMAAQNKSFGDMVRIDTVFDVVPAFPPSEKVVFDGVAVRLLPHPFTWLNNHYGEPKKEGERGNGWARYLVPCDWAAVPCSIDPGACWGE